MIVLSKYHVGHVSGGNSLTGKHVSLNFLFHSSLGRRIGQNEWNCPHSHDRGYCYGKLLEAVERGSTRRSYVMFHRCPHVMASSTEAMNQPENQ